MDPGEPEKEGKFRLVGAFEVLDSTSLSRMARMLELISVGGELCVGYVGCVETGDGVVLGGAGLRAREGKDMVALLAANLVPGRGSSRDESKETPLDGGLESSFAEIASTLASRAEIDSNVCCRRRSIFLKCS